MWKTQYLRVTTWNFPISFVHWQICYFNGLHLKPNPCLSSFDYKLWAVWYAQFSLCIQSTKYLINQFYWMWMACCAIIIKPACLTNTKKVTCHLQLLWWPTSFYAFNSLYWCRFNSLSKMQSTQSGYATCSPDGVHGCEDTERIKPSISSSGIHLISPFSHHCLPFLHTSSLGNRDYVEVVY